MLPYMIHAVLTSKGQVTIPIEAREALGLKQGEQLLVTYDETAGSVTLSRILSARELAAITSKLPRKDIKPVTDADDYYQKHRKAA